MAQSTFKTPYKIEKEAKELAIYQEWNKLMQEPGAMATAVEQHLMQKYNIFSRTTIWFIRQRVEKRLAKKGG